MQFQPGPSHWKILRFPTTGRRHLFAVGGYGGGKSAAVMRGCVHHASARHSGEKFAALAKSKNQLSEMAAEMSASCAEMGLGLRQIATSWKVTPFDGGTPNEWIPLVYGEPGAAGPAARLQGLNLAGAVTDEAVNMGDHMRRMLISRLRAVRHPLAWWSMNPDSPRHTFKTDMIDNPLVDSLNVRVPLADNPALPPGYIDELRANLPLPWMQARYIDGEWAGATGLVWPDAWQAADRGGNVAALEETWTRTFAGIDWSTKAISHAVLIGCWIDPEGTMRWHVIAEWYHDATRDGELTEPAQAERIIEAFKPWAPAEYAVDRTSHGLILALRERAQGAYVRPGRLDVAVGVANTGSLLADKLLTVDPACGQLITQMSTYAWPPLDKQPARGPVVPLKTAAMRFDGCEALRYGCESIPANLAHPQPAVKLSVGSLTPAEPLTAMLR